MLNNGRLPKKKRSEKQYEKEAKTKASVNKNEIEQRIKLNKNTSALLFFAEVLSVYIFFFLFLEHCGARSFFSFSNFIFVVSFERDVWKEINVLKWVDENKRKMKRIEKKNTLHVLVNSPVEIFQCWCMPLNTGTNDVKRM